jgi:Ala-tRNA(Pro) deacylase
MEGKERLESYLRENGVAYEAHHHPEAYTAQEVAAAEHVPGRMLAKVVALSAGDQTVMAVVPAPSQVDLDAAAAAAGAEEARLAKEEEFSPVFPDCDTGAMPPFGNGTLYDPPVYVDRNLADQQKIAFAACTHGDTIHMSYADFERLVEPTVADLVREER